MTALRAGQATDVGLVRANNQDQALVATPLFAVADGMGGHAAGEVASAVACEALAEAWQASARTPEALVTAAQDANRAVFERAQANPEMHGMGTTLVAVALTGSGSDEAVAVAHVGDSRVYALHQGTLTQVTADHSLVAELVAEGQIAAEEAERHPQRHVLSRALGVYAAVDVDLNVVPARPGDRFLLCSDGLSREVTDDQIAAILRDLTDPTEAANELVETAKAHGGSDNITVVVVDVDPAETPVGDGVADGSGASAAAPGGAGGAGDGDVGPAGVDTDDRTAPDATGVLPAISPASPSPAAPEAGRRRQRAITVRSVAFVLALVAVLALAYGGVAWYARSAWFVGLQGNDLVIYQGRPGGVLWFKPTVSQRTGVTTAQVEPRHLGELRAGMVEPSATAARQYVHNLVSEEQAALAPPATTTTVPAAPTTTTSLPTTTPSTPSSATPTTTVPGGAG